MKELIIHIPNNPFGSPNAIRLFESMLLKHAGGYTKHDVTGAWLDDDGSLYDEPMTRYIAACDSSKQQEIIKRLPEFSYLFDQICLYVVIEGEAQFIKQPEIVRD